MDVVGVRNARRAFPHGRMQCAGQDEIQRQAGQADFHRRLGVTQRVKGARQNVDGRKHHQPRREADERERRPGWWSRRVNLAVLEQQAHDRLGQHDEQDGGDQIQKNQRAQAVPQGGAKFRVIFFRCQAG